MPTWLEQLRPASFKGVSFQVDSIDWTAGDNVVVREYPFQDVPTVFRMGAATEEIKFSAYVIGDDYIDQREALRDALTGMGVLVHPTAGAMRVAVAGKIRMTEAPGSEGGMARFDLVFIRAEARQYPAPATSSSESASTAAEKAKAAAVDDFESRFSLVGVPGWVSENVVGRIGGMVDGAWGAIKTASAGLGDFTNSSIATYQVLRSGLDDLVATPRDFANQLGLLFTLPDDLSRAGSAGFQDAFSGLFDLGGQVPVSTYRKSVVPASPSPTNPVMGGLGSDADLFIATPTQKTLMALNSCVDDLFSTMAVAAFVDTLAMSELESYDQALRIRALVYQQCTSMLKSGSSRAASDRTPSSSWYDATLGLLSACLADLQGRTFEASRLMTWRPNGWMPIWVASHKIYGTTKWADEIMAMNPHITHPLLVPPGRDLTVLRHD